MENKDKNYIRSCFSLDIGTKSIVGIIGHIEDEITVIDYSHTEFHDKRVMFDGQIHDIDGVAEIALRVKKHLEEKSGQKLKNVSVAAAGRSLRTVRCTYKMQLNENTVIDKHIIKLAEINVINKAKDILQNETNLNENNINDNYYCVGHTIVEYSLDNSFIKTPLGHKGNFLVVEIIATFLPKIVVESLNFVMKKIDLQIEYMTLEPIAAIEVSVPENARLLNIAMVDIGAGTSDIAITKGGTISSYAMTSTAGDEITEAISENYLMDFDMAEILKCNLNISDTQIFEDIVGINHNITTSEILNKIEYSISIVSKNIALNILKENEKSPSAVFLVGGSSQIPRLAESLSKDLEIPYERVAIKRVNSIKNLRINENNYLSGPEYITPIGILVSALKNKKNDFIEVKINGNNLSLFRTGNLKISDAVLEAQINPLELMPQKGKTITIKLNDVTKKIYGNHGVASNIFLNDMPANLDSIIKDADNIVIDPAIKGKDAKIILKNLFEKQDFVYVNNEKINRIINIKINNVNNYNMDTELNDDDNITYDYLYTLEQLIDFLGYNISSDDISINGKACKIDDAILSESYITYNNIILEPIVVEEIKNQKIELFSDISDDFINNLESEIHNNKIESNNKDSINKENNIADFDNNQFIRIYFNDNEIKIPKRQNDIILADILDYVEFDRTKISGRLVITVNDEQANFASLIHNDDKVVLKWV